MSCVTVTTQAELDTALAAGGCIYIKSPAGVWLTVRDNRGNSSVEARGNSSVLAWGNSSVEAWDNSSVVAWDNSSVEAWDNSSVEAWAATRVRAYAGTINAGPHVAVHLHSAQATVDGGVLIDLTQLDLSNPKTWCDHHGVGVVAGRAVLYKAVDNDLWAGHTHRPTRYDVGVDVACPDWRDDHVCGGGLHLSPTPHQAAAYRTGPGRYLRVTAVLADLRPINDGGSAKCKVPACRVQAEVDRFGRDVPTAKPAAVSS